MGMDDVVECGSLALQEDEARRAACSVCRSMAFEVNSGVGMRDQLLQCMALVRSKMQRSLA